MLVDYAGARGRLTLDRAYHLGDAWGFQPKIDGCYARVSTDREGRAVRILGRNGREIIGARDLLGTHTGLRNAVLCGEWDGGTEAGRRATARRGYSAIHVFDLAMLAGQVVHSWEFARRHACLTGRALTRWDLWTVDAEGRAHERTTGRFVRPVPVDGRRWPIVPLESNCGALWRDYVDREGGEGLVAVRLDAPLGARNAKRKIKATDTIDATVTEVGKRAAQLVWRGHTFVVSARGSMGLKVGDVVEVAHDGFYEAGATPRFARIARRRDDL